MEKLIFQITQDNKAEVGMEGPVVIGPDADVSVPSKSSRYIQFEEIVLEEFSNDFEKAFNEAKDRSENVFEELRGYIGTGRTLIFTIMKRVRQTMMLECIQFPHVQFIFRSNSCPWFYFTSLKIGSTVELFVEKIVDNRFVYTSCYRNGATAIPEDKALLEELAGNPSSTAYKVKITDVLKDFILVEYKGLSCVICDSALKYLDPYGEKYYTDRIGEEISVHLMNIDKLGHILFSESQFRHHNESGVVLETGQTVACVPVSIQRSGIHVNFENGNGVIDKVQTLSYEWSDICSNLELGKEIMLQVKKPMISAGEKIPAFYIMAFPEEFTARLELHRTESKHEREFLENTSEPAAGSIENKQESQKRCIEEIRLVKIIDDKTLALECHDGIFNMNIRFVPPVLRPYITEIIAAKKVLAAYRKNVRGDSPRFNIYELQNDILKKDTLELKNSQGLNRMKVWLLVPRCRTAIIEWRGLYGTVSLDSGIALEEDMEVELRYQYNTSPELTLSCPVNELEENYSITFKVGDIFTPDSLIQENKGQVRVYVRKHFAGFLLEEEHPCDRISPMQILYTDPEARNIITDKAGRIMSSMDAGDKESTYDLVLDRPVTKTHYLMRYNEKWTLMHIPEEYTRFIRIYIRRYGKKEIHFSARIAEVTDSDMLVFDWTFKLNGISYKPLFMGQPVEAEVISTDKNSVYVQVMNMFGFIPRELAGEGLGTGDRLKVCCRTTIRGNMKIECIPEEWKNAGFVPGTVIEVKKESYRRFTWQGHLCRFTTDAAHPIVNGIRNENLLSLFDTVKCPVSAWDEEECVLTVSLDGYYLKKSREMPVIVGQECKGLKVCCLLDGNRLFVENDQLFGIVELDGDEEKVYKSGSHVEAIVKEFDPDKGNIIFKLIEEERKELPDKNLAGENHMMVYAGREGDSYMLDYLNQIRYTMRKDEASWFPVSDEAVEYYLKNHRVTVKILEDGTVSMKSALENPSKKFCRESRHLAEIVYYRNQYFVFCIDGYLFQMSRESLHIAETDFTTIRKMIGTTANVAFHTVRMRDGLPELEPYIPASTSPVSMWQVLRKDAKGYLCCSPAGMGWYETERFLNEDCRISLACRGTYPDGTFVLEDNFSMEEAQLEGKEMICEISCISRGTVILDPADFQFPDYTCIIPKSEWDKEDENICSGCGYENLAFRFKVIEVNEENHKILFSRKGLSSEGENPEGRSLYRENLSTEDFLRDAPQIGGMVECTVRDILADNTILVEGERWKGKIEPHDIVWGIIPEGEFPYKPGERIRCKVDEIDRENRTVLCNIRETLEKPDDVPEPGDILRLTVVAIADGNIVLNTAGNERAIVPIGTMKQFDIDWDQELKPGTEIYARLERIDFRNHQMICEMDSLRDFVKPGDVLECTVTENLPSSIRVDYKGMNGTVESEEYGWSSYALSGLFEVGETISAKVLEYIWPEGKLSLSIKALSENPWTDKNLKKNDIITAELIHMTRKTLFIEYEGLYGRLTKEDATLQEYNTLASSWTVGDKIECRVKEFDKEKFILDCKIMKTFREAWEEAGIIPGKVETGVIVSIKSLPIVCVRGIWGEIPQEELFWVEPADEKSGCRLKQEIQVKCIDYNLDTGAVHFSARIGDAPEACPALIEEIAGNKEYIVNYMGCRSLVKDLPFPNWLYNIGEKLEVEPQLPSPGAHYYLLNAKRCTDLERFPQIGEQVRITVIGIYPSNGLTVRYGENEKCYIALNDLGWTDEEKSPDNFSIGEELEVIVKKIHPTGQIRFSRKMAMKDPMEGIYEGLVTKLHIEEILDDGIWGTAEGRKAHLDRKNIGWKAELPFEAGPDEWYNVGEDIDIQVIALDRNDLCMEVADIGQMQTDPEDDGMHEAEIIKDIESRKEYLVRYGNNWGVLDYNESTANYNVETRYMPGEKVEVIRTGTERESGLPSFSYNACHENPMLALRGDGNEVVEKLVIIRSDRRGLLCKSTGGLRTFLELNKLFQTREEMENSKWETGQEISVRYSFNKTEESGYCQISVADKVYRTQQELLGDRDEFMVTVLSSSVYRYYVITDEGVIGYVNADQADYKKEKYTGHQQIKEGMHLKAWLVTGPESQIIGFRFRESEDPENVFKYNDIRDAVVIEAESKRYRLDLGDAFGYINFNDISWKHTHGKDHTELEIGQTCRFRVLKCDGNLVRMTGLIDSLPFGKDRKAIGRIMNVRNNEILIDIEGVTTICNEENSQSIRKFTNTFGKISLPKNTRVMVKSVKIDYISHKIYVDIIDIFR